MAGYGKSSATSYSDFYSKNSDVPNTNDNPNLSTDTSQSTPADALKQRRAALKRRLKRMKVQ
jgi:hypothetical protein